MLKSAKVHKKTKGSTSKSKATNVWAIRSSAKIILKETYCE